MMASITMMMIIIKIQGGLVEDQCSEACMMMRKLNKNQMDC